MTANSLYRTVGGLALPLEDTGESTGASLDPGRDILLDLLAAALNDELAARWSSATPGTPLEGTNPVQTTEADELDSQLLQTKEIKFPVLAVYRNGQGSWDDFSLDTERLNWGFSVDYVLGPLTAGERRRMGDFLYAALLIMGETIKRGGHRAYATQPGRTWQPKLVLGPGSDTANFSSVRIAPNSIQRGAASFSGSDVKYWALSFNVEATEIDSHTEGDPRSNDYAGVNATLGTGTIVTDDPDEASATIDDLVEARTYVLDEYDMLLNIAADHSADTRSILFVVTGNTAAVTITLPSSPAFSQLVTVVDGDGQAATYNITVDGNGKTISGSATQVISTNYARLSMTYNGTKWLLVQ